jgi:hypothetical protein
VVSVTAALNLLRKFGYIFLEEYRFEKRSQKSREKYVLNEFENLHQTCKSCNLVAAGVLSD